MQGLKLALTWIAVLAAVGCIGQSGSEFVPSKPRTPPMSPGNLPGIPPRPHCPCNSYAQSLPVRAQLIGVQAFPQVGTVRYELEAREILGPDPLERGEIHVSDHFGGYWNGQLGCGGSAEPPKVGDEVLALYRRGRQDGLECCEYIACSDQCPRDNGQARGPLVPGACQESCEVTTHDACAQHSEEAVMRGQLMLIPWGDQLVVGINNRTGASVSIAQSQISSLTKPRDVCMSELPDLFDKLYPPEPQQPPSEPAPAAAGSGASTTPHGAPLPPAGSAASPMSPPALPSAPPPLMPAQMNAATSTATPPPAGPEEVRVRCAK